MLLHEDITADEEHPDFYRVVSEVTRLTKDEMEHFYGFAKARLKAILALKKIVEDVDFKRKQNEKTIQKLLEGSPWILDPTYTQFLTADQSTDSLFVRLARELKIGKYAPEEENKRRPDLVFLLGNKGLQRLVIVELKSANIPLNGEHLGQLEYYMQTAKEWLENQGHSQVQILGQLVGTRPSHDSKAEGSVVLRKRIAEAGPNTNWQVRDYLSVLDDTEAAHQELMGHYNRNKNLNKK